MVSWVTILFLSRHDSPESFDQVLKACKYCVNRDKTFRFEEAEGGEGIRIFSISKNQAYKRGSYFKTKFGIYYQVIKDET